MHVKIAAAQYPITKHISLKAWAIHLEQWVLQGAAAKAQVLLFPEYGSMELVSLMPKEIREDLRQQIIELDALKYEFCAIFSALAKKYHLIIVAPSMPILENNKNVNRAYVFSASGHIGYQDKQFMTRFENESWGVSSGEPVLTLFEADWGTFGIQICYDVEFGIGSRLLSAAGAKVILSPSCTETIRGATRVHIGVRARAMENQIYTVVSQTVGEATWSPAVDINYGFAAFYATPDQDLPEEGIISTMQPQQIGWLTQDLDLTLIDRVREHGQVYNFKDHERFNMGFTPAPMQVVKQIL
jgi:predicted amidohydrolase